MKKATTLLLGVLLSLALMIFSAACGEESVAVESVSLDKTAITLAVGESGTLKATVSPDNATDKAVTWKSSDDKIATVTNGTVKGVAKGSATVTVTTKDGGKTASCTVTVTADEEPDVGGETVSVESVSLDKTTLSLGVGESGTLKETVSPANATDKTVTWKSSDEKIATVTNGTVKGVAKGSATVTVTTKDGGKTASCTVTVSEKAQTAEPTAKEKLSEDDFKKVLEDASKEENYTCVYTVEDMSFEIEEKFETGKRDLTIRDSQSDIVFEIYVEEIDGDIWGYSNNSGKWLRTKFYSKADRPDYFQNISELNFVANRIRETLNVLSYNAMRFDSQTGTYSFSSMKVVLSESGKILSFEDDSLVPRKTTTIAFSGYGASSLTRPAHEEIDQAAFQKFDAAAKKTLAAKNFTLTMDVDSGSQAYTLRLIAKSDVEGRRTFLDMGGVGDVGGQQKFVSQENDYCTWDEKGNYTFYSRLAKDFDSNGNVTQYEAWKKVPGGGDGMEAYSVHVLSTLLKGVEGQIANPNEYLFILCEYNESEQSYTLKNFDITNHLLSSLTLKIGSDGYFDKVTAISDFLGIFEENTPAEFVYSDFDKTEVPSPGVLPN